MAKPIFAIIGGLGAQGESALHAVAAGSPGQFKFRIFTKDTSSAKATALKQKYGDDIEFAQGGQADKAAYDKAFQGATWAFIVTNFWDPTVLAKEAEFGKAMADSAKKAGVKYVIYSSCPNTTKVSGGKFNIPHFIFKAEVEDHIKSIGLNAAFIQPAFYYQNWTSFFTPRANGDGTFSITLPLPEASYITAYDVAETGKAVSHVVKNWDQFKGKTIPLAGDHLHPQDFIKIIAEVTGLTIKLNTIPYAHFQQAAGEELTNMFTYFEAFGYFGPSADLQAGKKAFGLTTFKDWAPKNSAILKAAAK
jgi:uncharacterized protein YbjT (DUF2867 family)